jgi:hypothetical protein
MIINQPTQATAAQPQHELTRRSFIKAGTAAAFTAASWNRVLGANARVGIGVIGFGLVGRIHTRNFKAHPDAQVVAVSETFRPRMDAATEIVGGHVAQYRDFRKSQYVQHTCNFLECLKSRKEPNSDLESGHQVVTVCHLANISLRTGRKIRWHAEKEGIIGDSEAAKMLVRPYRKPWDAELRTLGGKYG